VRRTEPMRQPLYWLDTLCAEGHDSARRRMHSFLLINGRIHAHALAGARTIA